VVPMAATATRATTALELVLLVLLVVLEVVPVGSENAVRYFAHISASGPVEYGQIPGSIGVLESRETACPSVRRIAARGMPMVWPCGRSGSVGKTCRGDG
jgi:hypothetical protein